MFMSSGDCIMERKFIEHCGLKTRNLKFNIYLVDIKYDNLVAKRQQEDKFSLSNVNEVRAFNINESLEEGTKIDIVIGINDAIDSQCLDPDEKNVCGTLSYAGYHTPYIRVAGYNYYIQKVGEYIFKPLDLNELHRKFINNMNTINNKNRSNPDIFSLLKKLKITVKIDELMELDKPFYKGGILNFKFNDGTIIKYSELTDEDKQDNLGFFEICNIYKKIHLMQDLPSITIKLYLKEIPTKIDDNKCRIIIKKLWSSILYGFTPNIKIIYQLPEHFNTKKLTTFSQ